MEHAERTAKHNDHFTEVLNTDAKSDVDLFFDGIRKALQKKNPDIRMQSLMLEARPFQDKTMFLVTFEDTKKDKILKQFHVIDKDGKFSVEEL